MKSENISPFSSPSRYDKLQFLRLSCNKDLYRDEFQSDSIRKRNIVLKSVPSLKHRATIAQASTFGWNEMDQAISTLSDTKPLTTLTPWQKSISGAVDIETLIM